MQTSEFTWPVAASGETIYAKCWQPEGEVKAVVVLAHGLGEHINRYNHVGAFFAAQGIALIGNDHHGHGKTTGKRGHVQSFDLLLDEIDILRAEAEKRFPAKPVFIYGHSMGGCIVIDYLVKRQPKVAGVISTDGAIQLAFEPNAFILAVGKLMRRIFPAFTQSNQLDVTALSRDTAVVEAYKTDPLVHAMLSSELGLSLLERGKALRQFSGAVSAPTLLMHGTADRIIAYQGSENFARQAQGDVTYKAWEGLFHEIHNEPEKAEVLQYAVDWMLKRI